MKIGYPCLNWSIGCNAGSTFRLKSFTDDKFLQTVEGNLLCLKRILEYNKEHDFTFFRISSETVPFGSHEVNKVNWQKHFAPLLKEIGDFVKDNNMRISMHPDQFVLINSPREDVFVKSMGDLSWHANLLDLMELDETAKIQIHVGGVYGDKQKAMDVFVERFALLPEKIKRRLAVENDDTSYSLKDCMYIHKKCGIPIIFDTFHHECNNNGEPMEDAIKTAQSTWKKKDGKLMIDYSSQQSGERKGKHTDSIDISHFKKILPLFKKYECDVMLEIRDKETSALLARKCMG
ncbi:MAG: UV DNA damage repair endonuclease UvsE [Candidatus Woesearchaeota archaeon]